MQIVVGIEQLFPLNICSETRPIEPILSCSMASVGIKPMLLSGESSYNKSITVPAKSIRTARILNMFHVSG